ncbi:MAG: membrane dipeptidase [Polyangiaceae bacterium]
MKLSTSGAGSTGPFRQGTVRRVSCFLLPLVFCLAFPLNDGFGRTSSGAMQQGGTNSGEPQSVGEAAPSREATIPFVDLHVDLSYQFNYCDKSFEEGTGQFAVRNLVGAGVAGVVLPLFVPATVSKHGATREALEQSYEHVLARLRQSDVFLLPGANAEAGRVRTWLAFEGSAPVAEDLEQIPIWVARGLRVFGLVHVKNNSLAASATDPHGRSLGLTRLGKDFVTRVHREGGLIDVSHASNRTVLDVATLARRDGVAMLATHSNARAVHLHPRNLSDEALDAIASTGGIVGINFHSPFLRAKGRASIADVIEHIRYVAARIGVEHVALGSDFEGGIVPAQGLESVERVHALALAMREAGFGADAISAIFGGNALRVLASKRFPSGSGDAKKGVPKASP